MKLEREDAVDAVRVILSYLGVDLNDPNFCETPERVIEMYEEIFRGFPKDGRITSFPVSHDTHMVLVRDIEISSFCAHHLLPWFGSADVAYVHRPGGQILGLSKIARIVRLCSRGFTLQEQVTDMIAAKIEEESKGLGAAVRITATHTCMKVRGVRSGAVTTTTKMTGVFFENLSTRNEFLQLLRA